MTRTSVGYTSATGLPKKTQSICPECGKIIDAKLFEENRMVMIEKECPEHGYFKDKYWTDVDLYLKAEKFAADGIGLHNSMNETITDNDDSVHIVIDNQRIDMLSCTMLANVDLTNRCNMHCPICFANANDQGYVYEPSFEEVHKMLTALRNESPIKNTAVQFAGGEPTVHPRFVDIVRDAKQLGFAQVQVATNGLEFAYHYDFLKASKEAGLNTIYLQFDGMDDEIYLRTRGRKMWKNKLKVLENCRKLQEDGLHSPSIVLVPVIINGVNDNLVGDIINFAFENSDIIRAVNFQPVAFTGRITKEELEAGRFTLTDLVDRVDKQTGFACKDDWYPVPVVAPISKFASILLGHTKVTFTTHPHCGIATYLFQNDKGDVVPFPRFIDIDRFSKELDAISDKMENAKFKKLYALKLIKLLKTCIDESKMPEGLTKKKFVKMLTGVMGNDSKGALANFSWKMMLIAGMHFQDSYNYDIERVRRCGVHYITPDCRLYPFCAYNSGPEFRREIEAKFSVPVEEWKKQHKEEADKIDAALIVPEDERGDA